MKKTTYDIRPRSQIWGRHTAYALFAFLFIVMLLAAPTAHAQQDTRLEVTLERSSVSVGNPLYLYVAFYGAQDIARPEISPIEGLQIKYIGPSSEVSVVNGQMTRSITHTFLIIPRKGGHFMIGPFSIVHNGRQFTAPAVNLAVGSAPGPSTRTSGRTPSSPVGFTQPRSGTFQPSDARYPKDKIFLVVETDKHLVYINETVLVTIKLYVSGMGLRDIEFPGYSHEGFSADEFNQPQKHTETLHGMPYSVLVFRQRLSAIKEGDYVLGPAKLNCKIVTKRRPRRQSSGFRRNIFDDDLFNRTFGYDTYPIEVKSIEEPVTILPFPVAGRPSDFQGAVGNFDLDVHVDTNKVKVGDPVVLRMTISGPGNLDTVTAPGIADTDKFKIYEPQIEKKGSRKIYEQVFVPKTSDANEIPEVSFSFFNPASERYITLRKGPFPIEVVEQPESERAVKMVSMPGVEEIFYPEEELGKDIVHIKEGIGKLRKKGRFLYRRNVFWAGQFVPFILFTVLFLAHRKKERMIRDKGYARFLKAPRKARKGMANARAQLDNGEVVLFYDTIFKTLQKYLGDRFDLHRGNITVQEVEGRLCSPTTDKRIPEMLYFVFSKCEIARYASSVPDGHEAEEVMDKVKRIIDYMEKVKL